MGYLFHLISLTISPLGSGGPRVNFCVTSETFSVLSRFIFPCLYGRPQDNPRKLSSAKQTKTNLKLTVQTEKLFLVQVITFLYLLLPASPYPSSCQLRFFPYRKERQPSTHRKPAPTCITSLLSLSLSHQKRGFLFVCF